MAWVNAIASTILVLGLIASALGYRHSLKRFEYSPEWFFAMGKVLLAAAFGVASATAHDPEELAGLLPSLLAAREPVLVHVPVGEMPSPWHLIHEGLPRPVIEEAA